MDLFRREFRALWSALLYFTRLPLPCPVTYEPEDLRRAAGYWPLIGLLVGLVVGGGYVLSSRLLPADIAAGLALTAGILLTGAMHEDGLADVCDGLGGGATKQRALEIMKDSSTGVFGAIGLIVSLGLRWRLLVELPPAQIIALTVAAHTTSRAAACALLAAQDYVREGPSKARPLAQRMHRGRLALVLALGLAPLAFLPALYWFGTVGPAAAVLVLGLWFHRRLGGYTGDCLGATQQTGELAFLLIAAAAAKP